MKQALEKRVFGISEPSADENHAEEHALLSSISNLYRFVLKGRTAEAILIDFGEAINKVATHLYSCSIDPNTFI